jgi:hypothetical protein
VYVSYTICKSMCAAICAVYDKVCLLTNSSKSYSHRYQIWPSFESAVSARMAAAAQYPGDQTLSKEAAERLVCAYHLHHFCNYHCSQSLPAQVSVVHEQPRFI